MMVNGLIAAGLFSMGLALLPSPASASAVDHSAAQRGMVRGCVGLAGHNDCRGVASLWKAEEASPPDPRRAIRPPLLSGPLDTDGCFSLQAEPGAYYVGAIVRRTAGGWQGPPRPGDMVFLSPDASGGAFKVILHAGETVDIGRHAAGWQYAGFSSTATPYRITGTLTGTDGQPLAGLLVFAFADRNMSQEPVAVSEPSGADGRYLLRLPEPASVYLRAREHYGRRSPLEGGYMGIYGGVEPTPVAVANGGKQDCDLTIVLIPPLESRPKREAKRLPPPGE